MTFWRAILLGLIQGLTEFLPVSSSGHLFLLEKILNIDTVFLSFEIALHLATLLAVIFFFWPTIKNLTKKTLFSLLLATLPLIPVALFFNRSIDKISQSLLWIACFLLVSAVANYLSFLKLKKNKKQVTIDKLEKIAVSSSLKIGLFQVLGIFPGISRSAVTLFAALNSNISAQRAFQFSFLLSIPAIIGSAIFDLLQSNGKSLTSINWNVTLPAMLVAFISGLISLKLVQKLLNHNRFLFFALYCLILGLSLIFFT